MILELEGANGVRDVFDGIGLAMREIVHRIDAPFIARAMMFGV